MSMDATAGTMPTIAQAWHRRAADLARWSEQYLVNRTDAWGINKTDGTRATGHGPLDFRRLRSHFTGQRLIGVHLISLANTCKSIKIDIDAHSDGDTTELANKNFAIALELDRRAYDVGLSTIISDSNGKGGFHLEPIFAEPIPARAAYHFGLWLARDFKPNERGGIEVFPKRADRDTEKGFGGGWVRLYGKHHKRNHWTRIWHDGEWIDGEAAIDVLLSHTGNDPALLANVDYMAPTTPPRPASTWTPPASAMSGDVIDRAAKYVAKIPGAVSGQGGHDHTYSVAMKLVEGFALSVGQALPIMQAWNQTCNPPWSDRELLHKLESADARAEQRGYLLVNNDEHSTAAPLVTRLVLVGA